MLEITLLPNSKTTSEIRSYTLPIDGNLFEELLTSVRFDNVAKGRQGAILTKIDEIGNIPIVRTTTKYRFPSQPFQPIHERLAEQIQIIASLAVEFNNALIENYTNAYTTMGSHSDQALDLADKSSIAIFSCYQYPDLPNPPRKLIIESKESSDDSPKGTLRERIEIPLIHHSVVIFNLATNRRLKHKIVLDKSDRTPEQQWLGITFRSSKTLVRFQEGCPYFADDKKLTLADDEQRQEFYHLRHRENNETDFTYPQITYTISDSDMMPPENLAG